jgi:hypothetical protein
MDSFDYFLLGYVASAGDDGYLPLNDEQRSRLEALTNESVDKRLVVRYQLAGAVRYVLTSAGKAFVANLPNS